LDGEASDITQREPAQRASRATKRTREGGRVGRSASHWMPFSRRESRNVQMLCEIHFSFDDGIHYKFSELTGVGNCATL